MEPRGPAGRRLADRARKPLTFRRAWKATRRFVLWLVARVLITLLPLVPYPVLRFLCRTFVAPITRLLYRKAVVKNLSLAYGDTLDAATRDRIVKGVFAHVANQCADLIAFVRLGKRLFAGRLDDAEVRSVLADFERDLPSGWIAITGHVGNWELLGSWFAAHSRGGRCHAVAKRMPNARLNALVEDLRRRFGIEPLYRDDAASKPVHLLKSGGALVLVPDQDIRSMAGVFVDFFGRPAWTPVGPARLAYAANVPIWGGFFVREGEGFRIVPMEPIRPDVTRPKDAEVLRMTKAWSAQFEAIIRRYPEQWPWYHDRWKTKPKDAPALAADQDPE